MSNKSHKYTISAFIWLLGAATTLSSCEGEKDLVVYDGTIPLHCKDLYLVGDAVPAQWSIEDPTPMYRSEQDDMVFIYEGQLREGEFKVCLAPANTFDGVDFIRPIVYGQEIGETPLENAKFQMHADNPDEKWLVVAPGTYKLTFNLRDWTLSSEYLGENVRPSVKPIETDELYILGAATSVGWSVWDAPAIDKKDKYIFEYEGWLNEGEFRATTKRKWGYHIRPTVNHAEIGADGIEDENFMYVWDPDINWLVTKAGNYHLIFDLENWKLKVEYSGDGKTDPEPNPTKPIEADFVYIIGDATTVGWSVWEAEPITQISHYIFQYEGHLNVGEFRACTKKQWGAHIRPLEQHTEIGENGVANPSFMYVDQPDFCWYVTKQGNYRITFDLENYTITAEYLDNPGSEKTPIETETLFMVGTSTNGAWDGNAMTAFTQNTSDKYLFSYEGNLYEGEMKVYTQSGDDYPDNWAIRPAGGNAEIGKASITDTEFAFSYEPDDKWKVTESGMYRLTFNLRNWTMSCMYIGECQIDKNIKPVNASALYLLGDAAPSGWNVQNPTPMVKSSSYVFVYEGHLNAGRLRATPIKDWGAHIRPWVDNTSITTAGVSAANLTYVKFPDYNWNVETAGNYKLTIDLEHWTIKAEYLGQ